MSYVESYNPSPFVPQITQTCKGSPQNALPQRFHVTDDHKHPQYIRLKYQLMFEKEVEVEDIDVLCGVKLQTLSSTNKVMIPPALEEHEILLEWEQ